MVGGRSLFPIPGHPGSLLSYRLSTPARSCPSSAKRPRWQLVTMALAVSDKCSLKTPWMAIFGAIYPVSGMPHTVPLLILQMRKGRLC